MSSLAVTAAFRAAAASVMAASPTRFVGIRLRLWNEDLEADLDAGGDAEPIVAPAFLVLQFPTSSARQIGLGPAGARDFREEGTARLVLQQPLGRDPTTGQSLLEDLGRALGSSQFGGVTTWESSPPIVDDSSLDGAWWAMAIVIPYFFDYRA